MCALISTTATNNHLPGAIGSIANATGVSPEQILLDHNLIELAEWYARGIDFSNDKLAVDSIMSAGPRGNFLTDTMTLELLRTDEHFYAPQSVRAAAGQDSITFADSLHEKAEELINTHKPVVPEYKLNKALEFLRREEEKMS
jgi:trimethylamine:corrinoid methyltransferase-like protein